METRLLRLLIDRLADTGIERFEVQNAKLQLRILMAPGAARAGEGEHRRNPRRGANGSDSLRKLSRVTADADGSLLLFHPLGLRQFVRPGEPVNAGSVIALLKTGVLYRPVVAPHGGVVEGILVAHGDLVRAGTPLFELATSLESASL